MCDSYDDEGAAVAYFTGNGAALLGHGKLWAVSVTESVVSPQVDVYDGIDANGRLIWSSRDITATGGSRDFAPHKPVRIDRGIFVACAGALVTVVYEAVAYLREELK